MSLQAIGVETLVDGIEGGTGGVSVDRDGNVYVADFGAILGDLETMGRKIFKITRDRDVSIFAEGFEGASGNAIDRHGNLFQSSIRGNRVSRVTPAGEVSTYVSEGIRLPVGVALDPDGTLYVANCGSGSVQKVDRDGTSSPFCTSPLLKCPNGLARGSDGSLYVANFDNGDVIRITRDGTASVLATLPGGNNGHLLYHEDHLYVVARSVHQIYRVSLAGEIEPFAGSGRRGRDDGQPRQASFSLPNAIALGPAQRYLYINEVSASEGDPNVLSPMAVRRIRVER